MAELVIEYTDDGVTKRATLSIDDPNMPGDQLAARMLSAADMIMGRADRRFAAIVEEGERLGFVSGRDRLSECQRG